MSKRTYPDIAEEQTKVKRSTASVQISSPQTAEESPMAVVAVDDTSFESSIVHSPYLSASLAIGEPSDVSTEDIATHAKLREDYQRFQRLSFEEYRRLCEEHERSVQSQAERDNLHSLQIRRIDGSVRLHLETYLKRGEILNPLYEDISENIKGLINNREYRVKQFYFVEASSGMGKSQLAESLSLPVVYIPFMLGQSIYQCFSSVNEGILTTLRADMSAISDISTSELDANASAKYLTVGLLLVLLRAVAGKTNEESIRLLSGSLKEVGTILNYKPTSLQEARSNIEEEYLNLGVQLPCFIVDEVPPKSDKTFDMCILLRNLIRCMRCVCLLAGTEAASMNMLENLKVGSYTTKNQEYVRLVVRLAPTQWEIFETADKYRDIISQLDDSLVQLLKQTRPRFVNQILDSLVDTDASASSSAVGSSNISKLLLTRIGLATVKQQILVNKTNFLSDEGLYAQLALQHSAYIERLVAENACQYDACVTRQQYCLRHHFANLQTSEPSQSPVMPLFVESSGNDQAVLNVQCPGSFAGYKNFVPNIIFDPPEVDPLLYLICFRDGFYYKRSGRRVSSSFGFKKIFGDRHRLNDTIFGNSKQRTCSGKFLEMELASALISASHSSDNLLGCPIGNFLSLVVAELFVDDFYPGATPIQGVPAWLNRHMTVGLLSSCSASWGTSTDMLRSCGVTVADINSSTNQQQNDGMFHVFIDNAARPAACEAKCYLRKVPVTEVVKTITSHLEKGMFLTIMVATATANYGFDKYREMVSQVNLAKITRSSSDALVWASLGDAFSEHKTSVVIIDLESIFPGRYECMKRIYAST